MLTKEEIDKLMVEAIQAGEVVMFLDKKWPEYILYQIVQQAIHANDYRTTEEDFEPLMHRKYSGDGW